ncbi:hypothetical protein AMTR_s00067p00202760 [Amborella trichopoda]|uniref:Uncharacterized protein n=1 Tax=Amborella trichopoda TaxID=13333 RepID=U5D9R0_AMBTC|nr:hypothetical protein AMTR_s00067p00202760 [Amborella trichopoda]
MPKRASGRERDRCQRASNKGSERKAREGQGGLRAFWPDLGWEKAAISWPGPDARIWPKKGPKFRPGPKG